LKGYNLVIHAEERIVQHKRIIPNPHSGILQHSVVGGVGMGPPPPDVPPEGMAVVLLYVPAHLVAGQDLLQIQADMGIPWSCEGSAGGIFFDELPSATEAARDDLER